MFYDPETQTLYPTQHAAKKLGLPRVKSLPAPALADNQRASKNATPTQQPDGSWAFEWTVETIPPAEMEQRLQDELSALTDVSKGRDRAIAYTLADIWQQLNAGMTKQQARQQVRSRLEANLREIKGL